MFKSCEFSANCEELANGLREFFSIAITKNCFFKNLDFNKSQIEDSKE